jgi:hypothetical protein
MGDLARELTHAAPATRKSASAGDSRRGSSRPMSPLDTTYRPLASI